MGRQRLVCRESPNKIYFYPILDERVPFLHRFSCLFSFFSEYVVLLHVLFHSFLKE